MSFIGVSSFFSPLPKLLPEFMSGNYSTRSIMEIQHTALGNTKCFSMRNESAAGFFSLLSVFFFCRILESFCRQDILDTNKWMSCLPWLYVYNIIPFYKTYKFNIWYPNCLLWDKIVQRKQIFGVNQFVRRSKIKFGGWDSKWLIILS